MSRLYASVTGVTTPLAININTSHASSMAIANITCRNTTLDIGSGISIDLGYFDNHAVIFNGFVKIIERNIPENTYTITAHDAMTRAIDFFIVSSNPESPLSFQGITAENLVGNLMSRAQLDLFDYDATNFTFGIQGPFEVNLVSSFDFSRMVSDILTWHLWCDSGAVVNFKNRKPYVMTGGTLQPGDDTDERVADEAINPSSPIYDTEIIDFSLKKSDKDLRNRVVVYGTTGIAAEATASTSFDPLDTETPYKQILPSGYYKSVLAATQILDDNGYAQDAADYNLNLLNRLTASINFTTVGNKDYIARNIIRIDESITGTTGNWYIFSSTHDWGRSGYTCAMELRL